MTDSPSSFQGKPITIADPQAIALYNSVVQLRDSLQYYQDYNPSGITLNEVIAAASRIITSYEQEKSK